jgi:type II secretory pathway pseudopilin PulG
VARLAQNKRNTRAAFTLVEVAVAAGLLGITMAAFFACLASGLSVVNTSRQDLRATQILTQKTEAVRLCTWEQLQSLPTSFQDYYYPTGTTNSAPGITYYGTISVGPATCIPSSASYYPEINLVTISLVWTNYLGSHAIVHNRQMQTLVAYYGLVNYIYGSGFIQQ